jgi:hypothetical protein
MEEDTQRGEYSLGILVAAGIGKQQPGRAVSSFASALYGWLFRFSQARSPSDELAPRLSGTYLHPDRVPAHATLSIPAQRAGEWPGGKWLLAESAWASASERPQFLYMAHWIWKVSTCLLIMQFVVPLRRHWHAAWPRETVTDPGQPPGSYVRFRRARSAAAVLAYSALMGIAAMASVLISLLLLALAIADKLPIPRIDDAVDTVIVRLSAMLGDTYLLAHCPVQLAAMQSRFAADLKWLSARCSKIAIVGHSQGAAIAHQVLQDEGAATGKVTAFITYGQAIAKLHMLQALDWNPSAKPKALGSRVSAATGLILAGLPAVALLAHARASTLLPGGTAALWLSLVLVVTGLTLLAVGVLFAISAFKEEAGKDMHLRAAATHLAWTDYYASADPVSSGRIFEDSKSLGQPWDCREVFNAGSLVTDHNSYLRNQDEMLPWLIRDLISATTRREAPFASSAHPDPLGCKDAMIAARARRRRMVDWLIASRVISAALGAALWPASGITFIQHALRALTGPSNSHITRLTNLTDNLIGLGATHVTIGNLAAHLMLAILAALAAYLLTGILPWHLMRALSQRTFFRHSRGTSDPAPPERAPATTREAAAAPAAL